MVSASNSTCDGKSFLETVKFFEEPLIVPVIDNMSTFAASIEMSASVATFCPLKKTPLKDS